MQLIADFGDLRGKKSLAIVLFCGIISTLVSSLRNTYYFYRLNKVKQKFGKAILIFILFISMSNIISCQTQLVEIQKMFLKITVGIIKNISTIETT